MSIFNKLDCYYKNFLKYATYDREPFFDIVKKYLRPEMKILDIGAADGKFADYIGRPDTWMLENNEVSVNALKLKYANVIRGNVTEKLPFAENTFYMIHVSHLFEHLQYQTAYDFLKELDRILKIDGYLIISGPLLHGGFYDDFSHIKPYYPNVFLKYLVVGDELGVTAPLISSEYMRVECIFRYTFINDIPMVAFGEKHSLINRILFYIYVLLRRLKFGRYEKSGFTLVLQKK